MKKAEQSPVTMGGLTVHTMPIDGGYAVWTEDVSALRDIKENSELLADELADRNEILRYEYKREAKRRKVEEQNRLYDLLRSATQTQIDRIAELRNTAESQAPIPTAPKRSSPRLPCCAAILNAASI